MRPQLVLSLFPGIGLLDQGFEEEGFTVVKGPDLLWGTRIEGFHPPAARFDGIIGGPPCQPFSTLVYLIRATGREPSELNMIPDFIRCVEEAQPSWFLMENVDHAPCGWLPGYSIDAPTYDNRWIGGEQRRRHRFTFGSKAGAQLTPYLEQTALLNPRTSPRVLASGGDDGSVDMSVPKTTTKPDGTIIHRSGRRIHITRPNGETVDRGAAAYMGRATAKYFTEAKRLQGLPDAWDLPSFTIEAKVRALGNAVPLPMARALARSVKAALAEAERSRILGPEYCTCRDYFGAPDDTADADCPAGGCRRRGREGGKAAAIAH